MDWKKRKGYLEGLESLIRARYKGCFIDFIDIKIGKDMSNIFESKETGDVLVHVMVNHLVLSGDLQKGGRWDFVDSEIISGINIYPYGCPYNDPAPIINITTEYLELLYSFGD